MLLPNPSVEPERSEEVNKGSALSRIGMVLAVADCCAIRDGDNHVLLTLNALRCVPD